MSGTKLNYYFNLFFVEFFVEVVYLLLLGLYTTGYLLNYWYALS